MKFQSLINPLILMSLLIFSCGVLFAEETANPKSTMSYNEAINVVKDCYFNIYNQNNNMVYYSWNKTTVECSNCKKMSLREIIFIKDDLKNGVEEKVLVQTCKDKECKFFALYKKPLFKPEDEDDIEPVCLYFGKYKQLEDVWLEKTEK